MAAAASSASANTDVRYTVLVTGADAGNKFVHMYVDTHKGPLRAAKDAWAEVQDDRKTHLQHNDSYIVLVKRMSENNAVIDMFVVGDDVPVTQFASLSHKADVKLRAFIPIARQMADNF
jgi:hypothetical protein